jgi:hypothetical protein
LHENQEIVPRIKAHQSKLLLNSCLNNTSIRLGVNIGFNEVDFLIKIKLIEGNGVPFEKITMLLVGACFEGCLRKYDSAIDWKQTRTASGDFSKE